MYVRNAQPFDIDVIQVIDDMQYPVGWFYNEDHRNAMGITFDPTSNVVVVNMEALRELKNSEINGWRAEANLSTFMHNGKEIACDSLSRSDIDGVANSISLLGDFPSGFPMAWKATDNTYISLPDVAAFKDMFASMAAKGTANFQHAQMLKAKAAAASTPEELNLIEWE